MAETRKSLTNGQRFAICKAIEANIEPDGDGYIKYSDGWSDERIATENGAPLHSVSTLRKDLFGVMRRGVDLKESVAVSLMSRISELEARVTELERQKRVSEYVSRMASPNGHPS